MVEKDLSGVPEVVILKNAISGIPLRYGDALVGTADMMTDGSIRAHFNRSELPKELHRMMVEGYVDSLSIGPNLIPAERAATPSDEIRFQDHKLNFPVCNIKQEDLEDEPYSLGAAINEYMKTQMEAFMADENIPMHPLPASLKISRAIELVYQYVKDHLEKTDTHVRFEIHQVYVVWFCSVLQNWKALVSTELPDGMYYEVTYDGEKKRTYIDAYKKFDNHVVYDEGTVEQVRTPRETIIPRIPAGEDDRFA